MKRSQVIEMQISRSYAAEVDAAGVWRLERNTEITFWRHSADSFPRVRFIKYDNPTNRSIERVHRAIVGMVK